MTGPPRNAITYRGNKADGLAHINFPDRLHITVNDEFPGYTLLNPLCARD
jgi:hypothetical protein